MKKQVKAKLIEFSGTLLLASLLTIEAAPPGSQPTNAVIGRPGFGQRMGMIGQFEEAAKVIGSPIEATNRQPIGVINDAAVDLESGRLLYVIASLGATNNTNFADRFAIAPQALREERRGRAVVLQFDTNQLSNAPKFGPERTNDPGNLAFAAQVYQFYGQQPFWGTATNAAQSTLPAPGATPATPAQPAPTPQAQPGQIQTAQGQTNPISNARLISELINQSVKNTSNAEIGKIDDVILDLRSERVPFLILTQTNVSHAIPPMAFTVSPDRQSIVTGLDQNTLQTAPVYQKGQVQMLSNRGTALAIYQHFGKQPYFMFPGGLMPTGRQNPYRGAPGAPTPAPEPGTTPNPGSAPIP